MEHSRRLLSSPAPVRHRDPLPVRWSDAHKAKLAKLADGTEPQYSSADQELAAVLLLCGEGEFGRANECAVKMFSSHLEEAAADREVFFSFLYTFFVIQRMDIASAMLRDKYGFPKDFELRIEDNGVGKSNLLWEISPDRRVHRFTFDAVNLHYDDSRTYFQEFYWEFPLFANYAAQSDQEFGAVVINQADVGSRPGLAYCDNRPDYFLIPDYIFVPTMGYAYARQAIQERSLAWSERLPVAFWRGGTTGAPTVNGDWRSLERIRLCELAQQSEYTGLIDAGFSAIVQIPDHEVVQWICDSGLVKGHVPWTDWGRYRYQIDIDGNSSPWSNLFQRLLTGSPVLKVESRRALAQWFYDALMPWHNYVPIAPDLSDLVDKVRWLSRNDDFAIRVGANGLALAESLTYESELKRSVSVISSAFRYFRGDHTGIKPFGRLDGSGLRKEPLEVDPENQPEPKVVDVGRLGGLGDILMCTPALRALKQAFPHRRLVFYGNYLELLRGLPYVDELKSFESRPEGTSLFSYEGRIQAGQHIARLFADTVGVTVSDVRPDCAVDIKLVKAYANLFKQLPKPWVVINRRASVWTPNKDWPDALWDELVRRLKTWCGVIEVGNRRAEAEFSGEPSHLDLVGKTNLAELVAVIAACDINVTPVSGPLHIAAATRTPSVVIYGGYEPASATSYAGNEELASTPECSPCWLRTECPHDKKCLTAISVDIVEAAISRIWAKQADDPVRTC